MEPVARSRYEELLACAAQQHLTSEHVVAALASLIDFNDAYVKRRARRRQPTHVDTFLLNVAPALALAIALLQKDKRNELDYAPEET